MTRKAYRRSSSLVAVLSAAILLAVAMPPAVRAQRPPPPTAEASASSVNEAPGEPRKLEDYTDWRALSSGSGGDRVCYVTLIAPPAAAGEGAEARDKGRPQLYVTHRPGQKMFNVVSYFAGYAVKPDSDVDLDFGTARFRLFTQAGIDGAWSGNAELDVKITEAMKAGSSVTAHGTDAAGNEVADTFSLMGFTGALLRITQECRPR